MFIEIDQQSGLPEVDDNSECLHSIAEMESRGFKIIATVRTIPCTEIHFSGPFHIKFSDGQIVLAKPLNSDCAGIQSSHRIVLNGRVPPPGDKVAFEATED